MPYTLINGKSQFSICLWTYYESNLGSFISATKTGDNTILFYPGGGLIYDVAIDF